MERRNFLKATAIGSTCVLAGAVPAGRVISGELKLDYRCKITVLKRTLNKEWNKEFRNYNGELCSRFKEGQEFIVETPWYMPEGFCHWAWADIRTFIHLVNEGNFGTFVACCTDGFRPVFFKIERTEK